MNKVGIIVSLILVMVMGLGGCVTINPPAEKAPAIIPFFPLEQDDTALIQGLLDQGGLVNLPNGIFSVIPELVVPSNTVVIGNNTTIKVMDGCIADYPSEWIGVLRACPGGHNVKIINLTIDGNKYNSNTGRLHGIYFSGVKGGLIEKVAITDIGSMGIVIEDSQFICLDHFMVKNSGSDGLQLWSSSYNLISNGYIQDTGCFGISLTFADYNTIRDTTSIHNQVGLQVRDDSDYNLFKGLKVIEARDNKGDGSWWNVEFRNGSDLNTIIDSVIKVLNVDTQKEAITFNESYGNVSDNLTIL